MEDDKENGSAAVAAPRMAGQLTAPIPRCILLATCRALRTYGGRTAQGYDLRDMQRRLLALRVAT